MVWEDIAVGTVLSLLLYFYGFAFLDIVFEGLRARDIAFLFGMAR